MKIRKAVESDTGTVSSILTEAADWLISKGEKLWERDELDPDSVAGQVSSGMFRLAYVDGEAAGCYRFQESDEEYWDDVPHRDSAFIHRVAVRRKFAGRGISTAMIEAAKDEARSIGKRLLRLDCRAESERLRAVYERQGFKFHSLKKREPYTVARYDFEL
ncbi:MAG TPA: GNAT family N-acetyltransferase [Aridibacter sp.]|nr:GNAT family N-acetyltransferase [Aridibacter sp.]